MSHGPLQEMISKADTAQSRLLKALQLLVSAWNKVSQTTIVNCFKKAKISEKNQTIAITNEDDPFKEIDGNLKELREKEPSLVPENMTAYEFATGYDAIITTSLTLTDEEILQDATQTENDEVEEIEDDEVELVPPSTRNVENSFEILKNLSLFSEKRDDQMQDLINIFETLLTRDRVKKCKQVKITSYFVKQK